MTEKRFTLKKSGNGLFYSDGDYSIDNTIQFVIETVEFKLNQLEDENEQLKRKNKFLKNQYERKDRQLHRTKKDIEKYTDYFMNELNWDCDRIIKEVFK